MIEMTINRRSKKHIEVINYLKQNIPAIKIVEEYNVGDNLYIDIFLPDFSIGIEVDGLQHSQFIKFFHKDELAFHEQVFRDNKKLKLCKESGISLFRIKSTDNRLLENIISDIFDSVASNNFTFDNEKIFCVDCSVRKTLSEDGLCTKCKKAKERSKKIVKSKRRK
jgi:hypothetical protein